MPSSVGCLFSQDEGIWMWHDNLGWLWTEQTIYPLFFTGVGMGIFSRWKLHGPVALFIYARAIDTGSKIQ